MKDISDGDLVLPLVDGSSLPRWWLEKGSAILDLDQRIIRIDPSLANWLGVEAKNLIGKSFVQVMVDRFPEWKSSLTQGGEEQDPFQQITLKTNNIIPRQWFCLEISKNSGGLFVRLNSMLPPQAELAEGAYDEYLASDAARRNMVARLLRAEARLDNIVHRWPGVIFSQRPDFSFQFVSPHIEELTGVPAPEWDRHSGRFWDIIHEADAEELKGQIKRAIQTRQGVTTTYRIRHACTGRVAYVLEHRQAIVSGNGLLLGFEGMWLDVTRQTIAERRLSTAAWKETLGVLTMGLAHDFSNIMAGIHSLSESFLSQVDAVHPFHEGLGLIKDHSLQASQLVHRIIQLHHGKIGERNYHDLNDIIDDLIDLAGKIIPRRVKVHIEQTKEPLPLYVDAFEFRQVILNLTLNAADAMPQSGQLVFATSKHDQHPPLSNVVGTMPRLPLVCLEVRDNGCGIPARHLANIFDPFFTTKAMNKGSGLGLYNARLFAEKHQGAVSVESVEGVGTTFRVLLPQADFSEAERGLVTAGGQRRSLMLVGREGRVLSATAEFLRVHGYHVLMAETRDKVADLLQTFDYPLQAAFVLVDASDRDLASILPLMRNPKRPLKIILQIAGCNQDELESHLLRQADLVLTSDLTDQDIVRKLKSVLEESEMGYL